ncbi:LicD family protein, partial [Acidaminococcus timonensis]|uniref:LicD family protein n=1 Tax=Acidaminococcus timonensis TaxID=1871002 RepID=UPI0026F0A858
RTAKGFFSNLMAYAFVSRYIYEHRNESTDEYYRNVKNPLIYKIRLLIARCIPVSFEKLYDFFDRFVQNRESSSLLTCATGRKHYLGECIDAKYFSKAEDGIFEGINVKLPYEYKKYLAQLYGDYMKIPPIEKREHHFTTGFAISKNVKYKIDEE